MKARGEKLSMHYVTMHDEVAAAAAAGIHMLSIEGRFFDAEIREAAGDCFVQVGLPYGGWCRFGGRAIATGRTVCGPHSTTPAWGRRLLLRCLI